MIRWSRERHILFVVSCVAVVPLGCGSRGDTVEPPPAPARATAVAAAPAADLETECAAAARAVLEGRAFEHVAGTRLDDDADRGLFRDLHDCAAVASDDPARCETAAPTLRQNCVARWRFFHDARGESPAWRTVMADGIFQDCLGLSEIPRANCDALHDAIAAGDASACAAIADDLQPYCRALAGVQPEQCGGDSDCRELADRLQMLLEGGGLARIAREGTERDRWTASAALEGMPACEVLVQRAVQTCDGP